MKFDVSTWSKENSTLYIFLAAICVMYCTVLRRRKYRFKNNKAKWLQTKCRPKQGCTTVVQSSATQKKFSKQCKRSSSPPVKKGKEEELQRSFANCRGTAVNFFCFSLKGRRIDRQTTIPTCIYVTLN